MEEGRKTDERKKGKKKKAKKKGTEVRKKNYKGGGKQCASI